MRTSWSALAVFTGLISIGAPHTTQAQISSPIGFGLVGGTSSPSGHLSDLANSGWHAGAFLELKVPVIPIGFRLEGAWHQFHDKPFAAGGGTTGARIIEGTANATYTLLPLPIIKPYVIGGVGDYSVRLTSPVAAIEPTEGQAATAVGTTTQTKFGINAGVGVRVQLGGFAAFVEARWHDVFTSGRDVQMVPVSVGVRF